MIDCNTLQHTATHCNALLYTGFSDSTISDSKRGSVVSNTSTDSDRPSSSNMRNSFADRTFSVLGEFVDRTVDESLGENRCVAKMIFAKCVVAVYCRALQCVVAFWVLGEFMDRSVGQSLGENRCIASVLLQCVAVRCSAFTVDELGEDRWVCKGTATRCNTLQHTATHCSTLQHTATHCNTLYHTATHCITLQHTATHCNKLQHIASHSNTL